MIRFYLLCCWCFMALLLVSCASEDIVTQAANWSPDHIYREAHSELNKDNYDRAVKLYQVLITTYPGSPYARIGMLELAYTDYRADDIDKALLVLQQFTHDYNADSHMDYALYLIGYINYVGNDDFFNKLTDQDVAELQQAPLLAAYRAFASLINNYPQSIYSKDAASKLNAIVNALGRAQLLKARYYMSIKAYVAAIARANMIISHYRNTTYLEEALALEVIAYQQLNNLVLAQQVYDILRINFPHSIYLHNPWQTN
jgi:outer membrane protein assembly factor BamD